MTAQERYERSRAFFNRGDHGAALGAVREALALDPEMSEAHNFVGWILFELPSRTAKDLENAIAAFTEAHRLAPSDRVVFTNLCNALAARRPAEAIAFAERGVPAFAAEAHNWLGWHFANADGELARGITHLKRATEAHPSWGVAWLNLGLALERSGAQRDAWLAFDTAISCRDSHDPALARRHRKALEAELGKRGEEPPSQVWFGMDGKPLGPEYGAIEHAFRERRYEDAIAAIEQLAAVDSIATVYTMGLTEAAAERAFTTDRPELARRLADLAERGAVELASAATSGAEGMGRTYDLRELRRRLARWR